MEEVTVGLHNTTEAVSGCVTLRTVTQQRVTDGASCGQEECGKYLAVRCPQPQCASCEHRISAAALWSKARKSLPNRWHLPCSTLNTKLSSNLPSFDTHHHMSQLFNISKRSTLQQSFDSFKIILNLRCIS